VERGGRGAGPVAAGAAVGARAGIQDELALVAGTGEDATGAEAAERLLADGVATVVAKRGPAGAVLHDRSSAGVAVPALMVQQVVDPIGAGDAFCAGFLAARLEGLADPIALRWGAACGAAAVVVEGDMDGLPDRMRLQRLLDPEARDIVR
jgi:2-dehydro-3-deoxygluconokinase